MAAQSAQPSSINAALDGLMPEKWDLSTMNRVIWVSPDGNAGDVPNVGSYDTPYASINLALRAATPGTVVMLKPGEYHENVSFLDTASRRAISGTDSSPILLVAEQGPESTKVIAATSTQSTIAAHGSDNIGIIGINVVANAGLKGDDISGIKIGGSAGVTDKAQHILVAGNVVTGSGVDGIKTYLADDVYMVGNKIKGVFGSEGFDNVTLTNATFAYNQTEGIIGTSGLTVKFASENIDIYGNAFEHSGGVGVQAGGIGNYEQLGYYVGKYTEFETDNVNIHGNYISTKPINYFISLYALETGLLTEDNYAIQMNRLTMKPMLSVVPGIRETWLAGGDAFTIMGGHNTSFTDNFIDESRTLVGGSAHMIKIKAGTNGDAKGGIIDDNKIVFVNTHGTKLLDLSKTKVSAKDSDVALTGNNGAGVAWDHDVGVDTVAGKIDKVEAYLATAGTTTGSPPPDDTDPGNLPGNGGIIGTDRNDKLNGTDGNDVMKGAGGDDIMRGGAGVDMMLGGDGNDNISGGGGDDTVMGSNGNDVLVGGAGIDFALYRGVFSEYRIQLDKNGLIQIIDTVDGRDGIDTLSGVEEFCFQGKVYHLSDLGL